MSKNLFTEQPTLLTELHENLEKIIKPMLLESYRGESVTDHNTEEDITSIAWNRYINIFDENRDGIMIDCKDRTITIVSVEIPEFMQCRGIGTSVVRAISEFIEKHDLDREIHMFDLSYCDESTGMTVWDKIFSKFPNLKLCKE